MVFDAFLRIVSVVVDPILNPLLLLHPTVAMLLLSFAITLIITLIYKYTTKQAVMKELRDQLKKGRERVRKVKNDPKKQLEIQRSMMSTQHKYMMHSFRAMIFTFLPIIILLGWLQTHFAIDPYSPDDIIDVSAQFVTGARGEVTLSADADIVFVTNATQRIDTDTRSAQWQIQAPNGTHILRFDSDGEVAQTPLVVGSRILPYGGTTRSEIYRSVRVEYDKLIILNLFGWKLGWFGAYFLFSIFFSIALRKLLRVY